MIAEENTENPQEEQKLVHDTENPAPKDEEKKELTGAETQDQDQGESNEECSHMNCVSSVLILLMSIFFIAGASLWKDGKMYTESHNDALGTMYLIASILYTTHMGVEVLKKKGLGCVHMLMTSFGFLAGFIWFIGACILLGAGYFTYLTPWYQHGSNEFDGLYGCWLFGSILNLIYIVYEGVKMSENFSAKKKLYQLLALVFVFMANLFILAASSIFLEHGFAESFAVTVLDADHPVESANDLMVTASVFYFIYGIFISLHYFL